MKLFPEDQFILKTTKINLSEEELHELDNLLLNVTDWSYLTEILINRGIAPLVWVKLPQLNNSRLIPAEVKEKFYQTYLITLSKNAVFYKRFVDIVKVFENKKIPFITLKGIHLADTLYRDIGLRLLSDIDLLIQERDIERAVAVLKKLGYRQASEVKKLENIVAPQSDDEMVHYPQMILHNVAVELHIRLHASNAPFNIDLESVWKNALQTKINGVNALTLELHDLLIYLCVHLDKHFLGGRIQFTGYLDIVNILENYGAEINWELLVKKSVSYRCEQMVMKHIHLVYTYLNGAVPYSVVQRYIHSVSEKDKLLFIGYLKENFDLEYRTRNLLNTSKKVIGTGKKIRYFFYLTFPPPHVMMNKYNIKGQSKVWFYYPYRIWQGIKGLILMKT